MDNARIASVAATVAAGTVTSSTVAAGPALPGCVSTRCISASTGRALAPSSLLLGLVANSHITTRQRAVLNIRQLDAYAGRVHSDASNRMSVGVVIVAYDNAAASWAAALKPLRRLNVTVHGVFDGGMSAGFHPKTLYHSRFVLPLVRRHGYRAVWLPDSDISFEHTDLRAFFAAWACALPGGPPLLSQPVVRTKIATASRWVGGPQGFWPLNDGTYDHDLQRPLALTVSFVETQAPLWDGAYLTWFHDELQDGLATEMDRFHTDWGYLSACAAAQWYATQRGLAVTPCAVIPAAAVEHYDSRTIHKDDAYLAAGHRFHVALASGRFGSLSAPWMAAMRADVAPTSLSSMTRGKRINSSLARHADGVAALVPYFGMRLPCAAIDVGHHSGVTASSSLPRPCEEALRLWRQSGWRVPRELIAHHKSGTAVLIQAKLIVESTLTAHLAAACSGGGAGGGGGDHAVAVAAGAAVRLREMVAPRHYSSHGSVGFRGLPLPVAFASKSEWTDDRWRPEAQPLQPLLSCPERYVHFVRDPFDWVVSGFLYDIRGSEPWATASPGKSPGGTWLDYYVERVHALMDNSVVRGQLELSTPPLPAPRTYQRFLQSLPAEEGLRASQWLLFGRGGLLGAIDAYSQDGCGGEAGVRRRQVCLEQLEDGAECRGHWEGIMQHLGFPAAVQKQLAHTVANATCAALASARASTSTGSASDIAAAKVRAKLPKHLDRASHRTTATVDEAARRRLREMVIANDARLFGGQLAALQAKLGCPIPSYARTIVNI